MSTETSFRVRLFHPVFLRCLMKYLFIVTMGGTEYGKERRLYDVGGSRTMALSLFLARVAFVLIII